LLAAAMFAAPGIAAQGDKQGDKAEKQAEKQAEKAGKRADKAQKQRSKQAREEVTVGAYFNDQHREAARAYYSQHYSNAKSCPPGEKKATAACLPARRKWSVGPLPRG
jgi:hypothetical protein